MSNESTENDELVVEIRIGARIDKASLAKVRTYFETAVTNCDHIFETTDFETYIKSGV